MKNVFFTYIDNEFDREAVKLFSEKDWKVFFGEGESDIAEKVDFASGNLPEVIDLYIDSARFITDEDKKTIRDDVDRKALLESFEKNYNAPIRML